MATSTPNSRWPIYASVSLIGLAAVCVAAAVTQLWVLTVLPVGFLFGVFLQKGDLCGASAFSEVVLLRSIGKVWGLWVAIVVSMLGFALLDQLGWVTLNPKPMTWLSFLVGGLVFGVGTVLAGGCISGCLYKAGSGNLNSMMALPGVFLGIALIEHGPLNAFNSHLKTFKVAADDGGSVTLSSVFGLPFWIIALVLAVITIVLCIMRFRRNATPANGMGTAGQSTNRPGLWRRIFAQPWRPWQAGIAIGLLGMAAYLSSAASGRNYPLGVTHGVLFTGLLVTDDNLQFVHEKPAKSPAAASLAIPQDAAVPSTPPHPETLDRPEADRATAVSQTSGTLPKPKKIVWWLVGLVTSLFLGSWVSGRMSGQARLLPRPPSQTVIAFFGGVLVGAGAAIAKGCVIGNILSGIGLMSIGTMIFAAATVLANWVTTYFYLMGAPPMSAVLARTPQSTDAGQ